MGKSGGAPGNGGEPRKTKATPIRKEARAGLQLSVARTYKHIKQKKLARMRAVGVEAALAVSAHKEYLAAEILELSGKIVEKGHRKRVQPSDILTAVRGDLELRRLFYNYRVDMSDKPARYADATTCEWDKKRKEAAKQAAKEQRRAAAA